MNYEATFVEGGKSILMNLESLSISHLDEKGGYTTYEVSPQAIQSFNQQQNTKNEVTEDFLIKAYFKAVEDEVYGAGLMNEIQTAGHYLYEQDPFVYEDWMDDDIEIWNEVASLVQRFQSKEMKQLQVFENVPAGSKCIQNPLSVRGYITLISDVAVDKKPDFASVGGFCIMTNQGTIDFDWLEFTGMADINDDGRLEISFEMRNFDVELFNESNTIMASEFSWESLTGFDEIYYDVEWADNCDIAFSVHSFGLLDWNEEEKGFKTRAFSNDMIRVYNKEQKALDGDQK
ncbi:hypothetical protein [Domibacillus robiginosus]|uniref:hypothetical protein n=1 Tax=Domibacillus robiginosus TaxID=1071054 RepID=UPI00067D5C24|nr:hypothetical protein [Domibacillus robiginosus]